MSLALYDEAIINKIKAIFDNIVWSSPELAFKQLAQEFGNVSFPAISLFRPEIDLGFDTHYNMFEALKGRPVARDLNGDSALVANSVPLKITIQVDLWSQDRHEVDEFLSEMIMFFIEEPKVTVVEPISAVPFDYYLKIEGIVDNSDLTTEEEKGKIYRQTITLSIDDARIFRVKNSKLVKRVPVETSPQLNIGMPNDKNGISFPHSTSRKKPLISSRGQIIQN